MLQKGRILLTIYVEEGFHSRVEGKGFNKKRPYKNYKFDNQTFKGRIPEQREYVSYSDSKVRTTILPEKIVEYFQSVDSKPLKYCREKNDWNKMKPSQRLVYNLQQLTEGKKFEYSIFE
jgi:hypothetical protein